MGSGFIQTNAISKRKKDRITRLAPNESTVGPRLIGPIGTEDFSPSSQDNF